MITGRPTSRIPPYRRPVVWVLALLGLSFGVAYWRLTSLDSSVQAPSRLPVPAYSSSRFENTQPAAVYVGSQACVACHADQFESYRQTAHSRSMALVDPSREPPDGQVEHSLSHRAYEIVRSPTELRHREMMQTGDRNLLLADHAVDYRIGSGRIAHSYAALIDDYLIESPVTWYASQQAWGMSPGYDVPAHQSFQRVVNHGCLWCHAGHVERNSLGTDRRLQITETAIGCERCHGPGSLHVERRKEGTALPTGVDTTIVNPAHLTRSLSESVCAQCHLMGDASVLVRGRSLEDYRPGLPLEEYRVDYRHDDSSSGMTVVGHVDQLRQSRCYQASRSLTCTTCHNPHRPLKTSERIEHFRAVCLNCHGGDECTVPQSERNATRQDDCVSCHMPQSSTEVQHVAFTHHRIGLHPQTGPPAPAARPSGLVATQDISALAPADQERLIGLAYMEWLLSNRGETSPAAQWQIAEQHLFAAYQGGAADADVIAGLATISLGAGNLEQAQTLCDLAAELDSSGKTQTDLLSCQAWIHLRQQQFGEARRLFTALVDRRRDAIDWHLLGVCNERLGLVPEAMAAFEKSIEIDPAAHETHRKLRDLYQSLGNAEKSADHDEIERALRLHTESR